MTSPDRATLHRHLVAAGIAGDVATPRESTVGNISRMLELASLYTFGLHHAPTWTFQEVLALLARQAGVRPEPEHVAGAERIDPQRTLDALDAMAARLALAGRRRERVLVATGHPTGLLPVHLTVAAALRDAGAATLTPGPGVSYLTEREQRRHVRHVGGVAMAANGADLCHTHAPDGMRGMLDALAAAGEAPPGLVVADHGFAGAAGEAGLDVVGFADCNDPALFVGEAEGKIEVCVPLDDNVLPHLYDPVAAYLVRELRSLV